MKFQTLCIAAITMCLAACGRQEPAESQPPAGDQAAPPAEEAPAQQSRFDQAFIDHMHDHADHLDDLMFALADGDLQGAMTPAFWLSRHEAVAGVPDEWQQYVAGMREAAREVETATDLESARAAAERISDQCQYCHDAAGINVLDNPD